MAETQTAAAITVQEIPLKMIDPSPYNRRTWNQKALDGLAPLAESIMAHGVQQPLKVRPIKDRFQIVFGERRWRASKIAEKNGAPCIVEEMDDKTARILCATENLQRDNLPPIEEAQSIQDLLDLGFTLDEVAAELGYDKQRVARRAQLTKLAPCWVKALEGKNTAVDCSEWPAASAEAVARLPEDSQVELFELMKTQFQAHCLKSTQLQEIIDSALLNKLSAAPWSLKLTYAKIQPCDGCPKRTSCQPDLFEEKGKADRCMDPDCWKDKQHAYIKHRMAEAKQKHGDSLIYLADGILTNKDRERLGVDLVESWRVQNLKKEGPGAIPALVVHGSGLGVLRWVKMSRQDSNAAGASNKPQTLEQKMEKIHKRRRRLVRENILERLDAHKARNELPLELQEDKNVAALLVTFGMSYSHASWPFACEYPEFRGHAAAPIPTKAGKCSNVIKKPWDLFKKVRAKKGVENLAEFLAWQCLEVLRQRVQRCGLRPDPDWPEVVEVCKVLKIDLAQLEREAETEIPYPTAWANDAKDLARKPAAKKATKKTAAKKTPAPAKKTKPKKTARKPAAKKATKKTAAKKTPAPAKKTKPKK